MPRDKGKRFSLVELLVVIAVIAMLTALLLPALTQAKRTAHRMACASNMKQIYIAGASYAADFNDYLPGGGCIEGGTFVNCNQGNVLWWIKEYLQVTVYNAAYTAPLSDAAFVMNGSNIGGFKSGSAQDKKVLKCPGSASDMAAYQDMAKQGIDYVLCGFGVGGYVSTMPANAFDKVYNYPRLSKLATSYKGYPKAFIIDNTWLAPGTVRPALFSGFNNHAPSNPKGMNVCDGAGAVNWVVRNQLFEQQGYGIYVRA